MKPTDGGGTGMAGSSIRTGRAAQRGRRPRRQRRQHPRDPRLRRDRRGRHDCLRRDRLGLVRGLREAGDGARSDAVAAGDAGGAMPRTSGAPTSVRPPVPQLHDRRAGGLDLQALREDEDATCTRTAGSTRRAASPACRSTRPRSCSLERGLPSRAASRRSDARDTHVAGVRRGDERTLDSDSRALGTQPAAARSRVHGTGGATAHRRPTRPPRPLHRDAAAGR